MQNTSGLLVPSDNYNVFFMDSRAAFNFYKKYVSMLLTSFSELKAYDFLDVAFVTSFCSFGFTIPLVLVDILNWLLEVVFCPRP